MEFIMRAGESGNSMAFKLPRPGLAMWVIL